MKLRWQKWKDPLDEALADWQEGDLPEQPRGVGPVVTGPMGFLPVGRSALVSAQMNFWVAETTFDVTQTICDILTATEGVEELTVMTRYRFRVGIGRLFDDAGVRKAITLGLLEHLSPRQATPLDVLRKNLRRKFPCWAIARTPSGKLTSATGRSPEEVEKKLPDGCRTLESSW